MRTALITTTINIPKVLALYRKLGPDVRFFVAGDHKTPKEAYDFCGEDLNIDFQSPNQQMQLGYKCSELIGWNTVRRRNIALLEALKWGADIIVTVDDDNIPLDQLYFQYMTRRFLQFVYDTDAEHYLREEVVLFSGLKATSLSKWLDAGQLMLPRTPHRGFPYAKKATPGYEPIVDAKIGVAAGLCLGDPDIDAVTRIANAPIVHNVSELARAGVVTDPRETWTVFNTQNTAFIRELAPAMFCAPGLGRFDDIVASLITQRVMRSRGLHVHFGQPLVWQQRNSHNLIRDLEDEVWGMKNLTMVADLLDVMQLGDSSVLEMTRKIYETLLTGATTVVPPEACRAALAFLDDAEKVL